MTTGVKIEGENFIFTSGASETLLKSCDRLYTIKTGETRAIDKQTREFLNKGLNDMASRGLRTVGIAFKTTNQMESSQAGS